MDIPIPLPSYKTWRHGEIDKKTEALILDSNFDYDGEKFSLSSDSRAEWLGLKTLESSLAWPVILPTITGGYYTLVQANLDGFINAGLLVYRSYKQSSRLLKEQIDACATLEEAAAIVDDRT